MMADQNRISTMGTSILSRFIECSTQFPDNPAIFVDDRSYTYDELNGLCSAICALLKAHEIKKGDRVGILRKTIFIPTPLFSEFCPAEPVMFR